MPKADWEANNLAKLFNLPKVGSVLDVACGLSLKSKFIEADIRVGVDIFPSYLEKIESEVPYVAIKGDVRDMSMFLDNSFDIVIACDIVEHLEAEDALKLIAECERIARVAVIIETPRGFVPQNLDILGHGGHEWQTHRSGWEPEQFEEMGYNVIVRDYEMSDAKRHTDLEICPHIQIIDAIKYV